MSSETLSSGVVSGDSTNISRPDGVKEAGGNDSNELREFTNTEFNWLKRIESILRNGLPNSDKGVAETIAHAHSEIELLLESIDEDWWMK